MITWNYAYPATLALSELLLDDIWFFDVNTGAYGRSAGEAEVKPNLLMPNYYYMVTGGTRRRSRW